MIMELMTDNLISVLFLYMWVVMYCEVAGFEL